MKITLRIIVILAIITAGIAVTNVAQPESNHSIFTNGEILSMQKEIEQIDAGIKAALVAKFGDPHQFYHESTKAYLFEDGSHEVLGCVVPDWGCTPVSKQHQFVAEQEEWQAWYLDMGLNKDGTDERGVCTHHQMQCGW